MSTEVSGTRTPPALTHAGQVSLSKWVNEALPPLTELLSAHEVARLARRHRWILATLTLLGRFPKQERFRGRAIGWKRRDIERWLRSEKPIATRSELSPCPRRGRKHCSRNSAAVSTGCSRRTRRQRWRRRIAVSTPFAPQLGVPNRPANSTAVNPSLVFDERSES